MQKLEILAQDRDIWSGELKRPGLKLGCSSTGEEEVCIDLHSQSSSGWKCHAQRLNHLRN